VKECFGLQRRFDFFSHSIRVIMLFFHKFRNIDHGLPLSRRSDVKNLILVNQVQILSIQTTLNKTEVLAVPIWKKILCCLYVSIFVSKSLVKNNQKWKIIFFQFLITFQASVYQFSVIKYFYFVSSSIENHIT